MRSLNDPAMLAQPFAALDASSCNPAGNASSPEIGPAAPVVVAFVGMQLRRPLAGSILQARNGGERVHTSLEHHGVVSVGATDEDHQWNASGVYNDVSLGAELASVCGVGACFLAPRGLETEEPSMLARLQSIWSCSRRRTNMAWCKFCQTPLAFQSRKRRQQVMPLP